MSCAFNEQELIGIYTPVNYKNTFDTIQLHTNNVYHRRVYDRNKKLVLEMDGEWKIDGDFIKFEPFYLNLDDDLILYPQSIQDTTGGWGGYLEKKNGSMEFCVGHLSASLPNQNCYQQLNKHQ